MIFVTIVDEKKPKEPVQVGAPMAMVLFTESDSTDAPPGKEGIQVLSYTTADGATKMLAALMMFCEDAHPGSVALAGMVAMGGLRDFVTQGHSFEEVVRKSREGNDEQEG